MKIEDKFAIRVPQSTLWAFIRQPSNVAACLPGCEAVEEIDETHVNGAVVVKFGPIRVRFILNVEIVEETPPSFIKTITKGEEGGRASTFTAVNILRLEPDGESATILHYDSDVSIAGKLANYGLGLMKKKAESLAKEFAKNVEEKISNS